jgi:hypothetical protein
MKIKVLCDDGLWVGHFHLTPRQLNELAEFLNVAALPMENLSVNFLT